MDCGENLSSIIKNVIKKVVVTARRNLENVIVSANEVRRQPQNNYIPFLYTTFNNTNLWDAIKLEQKFTAS